MSMSCKDSFLTFVRHVVIAVALLQAALLGLEWLMPGSVLPFVDLVDIMLPLSFILLIIASRETMHTHWTLAAHILVLSLIGAGVLAILALRMENYGTYNTLLLGAGGLALIIWAMAAAKGGES